MPEDKEPIEIVIDVEGGLIQHIDMPNGVRVIVHDYDVEWVDEAWTELDEDGDEYIESVWENTPDPNDCAE